MRGLMKLSAAQRKLKTEKLVKKRNAYTLSVYVAEIGAIPFLEQKIVWQQPKVNEEVLA